MTHSTIPATTYLRTRRRETKNRNRRIFIALLPVAILVAAKLIWRE